MTISFNQIPANIRSPLTYIEVNASNNSLNTTANKKILVLGQKLTTGTIAANTPVLVSNNLQANLYFGQGSILANMFEKLFLNNQFTEKWAVALDDNGAGVAATGSIAITGPATAAGTLSIYLGGVLVSVAVAAADTATIIGDALEAAITALPDLPVTAVNTTGTVALTYRHKGLIGNYYNVQANFYGVNSGEALPAGVAVVITQLSGGTTDPTLTSAIAALPEDIFDYWLVPYQADAVLDILEAEMESRWGPTRMLEGHVFAAMGGTTGALDTAGSARNSAHSTLFDAGLSSPTPAYLWAAAMIGRVAESASADPALPFTTLPLSGIIGEAVPNRRNKTQKETLLFSGVSTHITDRGGNVLLERMITTYQTNSSGVADAVWLDLCTPLTISHLRQLIRSRITSKYARFKLADDGNNFGSSSRIVTPSTMKAELVAWALEMIDLGLIENIDSFIQYMIVERDTNDRTRLNVSISPNLVNQLYIVAISLSFIL